ncbi:Sodium/hydrogen exchanger family-domain-containing protein [Abortiporus biennis]|nr:Sodium/hydrogen exchanger family-domain-containing protein [Abortiporus biennis]
MLSLLVKERLYINEVVLGTAFGILMGPHCANIFNPRSWGDETNVITLEVMRIVLATGLFAIGVELPQSYLADHAKGLLIMVVPTMAFGWIIVAAIIFGIFPPLNFISSLAIAACLTPTDPIICAAIVGGKYAMKHVPANLRRIIAAESAANDGLAYPFLSISIYLTVETSRRVAIGKWFLVGWLYQVILGTVLGSIIGIAFSKFMKFASRKGFIDRESYVAQYLALTLLVIGVVSTLGSDDLLAAFAAGSAISWDGHFNVQIENEVFSSVIDLLLNCGCFVYIGAWLPFDAFNTPELGITPWRLVVLFLCILAVRRIPAMLLLYRWVPEISGWKEALFSGHFGPMGVGAIFVSTLALNRLPKPQDPPQNQQEFLAATIQTIVSFVVLGSIIIHGLSIPFFSFGRRTVSMSRTWTSRNTTAPDWLLWARRTPGPETPGIHTPHLQESSDLENGVIDADSENRKFKSPPPHPSAEDVISPSTDATVMSEEEALRENTLPFGEAGMIEDPAENSNLASRMQSSEDVSMTTSAGQQQQHKGLDSVRFLFLLDFG